MSLKSVLFKISSIGPVLVSILGFPLILLAWYVRPIGNLYYWFIFSVTEKLFLSKADKNVREKLFAPLQQEFKMNKNLKILEIGPGTGGNFAYMPHGSSLSIVEKNPLLEKHTKWINKKFPHVIIEKSIVADATNMSDVISDESFDVVIGTHILCCIQDPKSVLNEINRILKIGGAFYTCEFVYYEESWKRKLQDLFAPFWKFFGLGCKAGAQDTLALLSEANFDISLMKEDINPDLPLTHNRTHYGLAVKQENPVVEGLTVISLQ